MSFNTLFYCLFLTLFSLSCYGVDVSIVGFIMPEDGLGKIPINILETLGDSVSTNYIPTDYRPPIKEALPHYASKAISNPDSYPGKVCIFTEVICSLLGNNWKNVPKESFIKIAYSMFEADRIPEIWIKNINETFDLVVVPDPYYVKVYQDSGINIPVFVLPIPMILNRYLNQPLHQFKAYPFVFGDASANKNPEALLEGFAQAFGNSPHHHLVLRAGYLLDESKQKILQIVQKYRLQNVTIEEGHILIDQYIQRLSSFDCYVNLSRGEGFSFIPREALALGIPVIIANNTASTTICNSQLIRPVKSVNKIKPKLSIHKILYDDDCGYQQGFLIKNT
jgi:glycosyltransferase involved in cell wall biosynthesis